VINSHDLLEDKPNVLQAPRPAMCCVS